MSIKLTDKQFLMLSQFAYLDFTTEEDFEINFKGKTLAETADILIKDVGKVFRDSGGLDDSEFKQLLKDILYGDAEADTNNDGSTKYLGNNGELRSLELLAFAYKDTSDGFVAYAFKDKDSEDTLFAFRGSESHPEVGSGAVDWIDNIIGYGIVNTSFQYEDVKNFVSTHKSSGQTYVTGHSKGGANAAYACAAVDGVTGIAFDGPGIGQTLTIEDAKRLEKSGLINCIAQNDIVGPLLFHPEHMKFCLQWKDFIGDGKLDGTGIADGHYTQAFRFDEHGYIIEAQRTLKSSIFGRLSKLIWYAKEYEFDPNKAKAVMTQLFCDDGDVISDEKSIIYEGHKLIKDIEELASSGEEDAKELCKWAKDEFKIELEKLAKNSIIEAFSHVAATKKD
ncbi:MAG: DUF2974 domain-containing protein [Bacillota bacterium]|nr:DUF2974 domain-containing protein [Bacillota bacterium]